MTVRELIDKLLKAPLSMEVYCTSSNGEYEFNRVEEAKVMELNIIDKDDNEIQETVFVIEDN